MKTKMGERNDSNLKVVSSIRKEGVNPLYLVTSKSENSNLNKADTKSLHDISESTLLASSDETNLECPGKSPQDENDKRHIYLSRTLKTPSTLSSSKSPKNRSTPAINSAEMIVVCIDVSKEMKEQFLHSADGERCTFMHCIEKALKVFISNKLNMSSAHKFALMFLTKTALWMHDFTADVTEFMNFVKNAPECDVDDKVDMNDIFDALMMKYGNDLNTFLSIPNDSEVMTCSYRLLVIYGRSKCIPQVEIQKKYGKFKMSERFTIDVLYIYSDENLNNSCEKIYYNLGEFDFHGNSYIFAVNKCPEVFECFARLLGHPFQRPHQQNCYHILED